MMAKKGKRAAWSGVSFCFVRFEKICVWLPHIQYSRLAHAVLDRSDCGFKKMS